MIGFVYRPASSNDFVYPYFGFTIHKLFCGLQNIHKLLCGYYFAFQYPQNWVFYMDAVPFARIKRRFTNGKIENAQP